MTTTGTRTDRRPPARPPVVRNNLATRGLHAAVAVSTVVLLGTGWWLRSGREGRSSVLADVLDAPDTDVHRIAGWMLAGLVAGALTLGVRGAWTFARETARIDRGDRRWFRHWPAGALTGRFAPHRGHFDPGQRIANLAFVATLGVLIGSGIALTTLSGGSTFAALVRLHRGATYVLTVLVVGHIVIVSGALPGYRGAWRAMAGRGRVPAATARRLWPADAPPDPPAGPDPGAPGPGAG